MPVLTTLYSKQNMVIKRNVYEQKKVSMYQAKQRVMHPLVSIKKHIAYDVKKEADQASMAAKYAYSMRKLNEGVVVWNGTAVDS